MSGIFETIKNFENRIYDLKNKIEKKKKDIKEIKIYTNEVKTEYKNYLKEIVKNKIKSF